MGHLGKVGNLTTRHYSQSGVSVFPDDARSRGVEHFPLGPLVEVILGSQLVPDTVRQALARMDARATFHPMDTRPIATADVRVVVAPQQSQPGRISLQALLAACRAQPCPILVVSDEPPPPDFRAGLGRPLISFVNGISVEEMVGRLSAMCAFNDSFRQYEQELTALRSRESHAVEQARHLNAQLQLAARIQQNLLPDATSLVFDRLVIRTVYLPADTVSGDVYEIASVGDRQVRFALIDATGHGMAAALLTAYVQGTLRGEGSQGPDERALNPDQVLSNLNEELIGAQLADCEFVTGLFASYDPLTGMLDWARGAAPYPILLRASEPPQLLKSLGPLIGVFPDQQFERCSICLGPADWVLFVTDGLEALLTHEAGRRVADDITQTDWFRSLRGTRVTGHLDAIHDRLNYTPPDAWPRDDITVVALMRDEG